MPGAGLAHTQVTARASHTMLLRSGGGAVAYGCQQSSQCALPEPGADLATLRSPPERATRSCSGALARPWLVAVISQVSALPWSWVRARRARRSPPERATQCRLRPRARPRPVAVISQVRAPDRREAGRGGGVGREEEEEEDVSVAMHAPSHVTSPPPSFPVAQARCGIPPTLLASPLRGERSGSGDIGGTIGLNGGVTLGMLCVRECGQRPPSTSI